MVIFVTCKNEEDSIKNEGSRVLTIFSHYKFGKFFKCSRAANSEVRGGIPPKFELIQTFIVVLVTYKNEKDPNKNEGSRVLTRFSKLYLYGIF